MNPKRCWLAIMVVGLGLAGWAQAPLAAPESGSVTQVEQPRPPALLRGSLTRLPPVLAQLTRVTVSPPARSIAPQDALSSGKPSGSQIGEAARKLAAKYDVSRIGDRGIGGGVNFYSVEKEIVLGKELAGEVERQSHLLNDPVITEYINRVGQNLVRNSDALVPFTIKVVDNDEVNAFTLPGGFFYVNTGLILAADNEAELAGVMAHEIAHVAARHATRQATKGEIWNLVSIPLVFVGGPVGYVVRQVTGLAAPMTFLKFSRDAEREADLLGLEYQYAAGYDPVAFVDFFEKLQLREKKRHSFIAKAFATHPMTEDRIKRAEQVIQRFLPAREEYKVTTSEFEDIKARLGGQLNNDRRVGATQPVKPRLRRHTSEAAGAGEKNKDNQRPTLRRQ